VAVIVAEMRLDPVFVAIKEPILPCPVEANPIEGLLLIQLYKHPFAGKATGLDEEPFEMTWLFWEKLSNMNKIR
jgi:hypothetical protein